MTANTEKASHSSGMAEPGCTQRHEFHLLGLFSLSLHYSLARSLHVVVPASSPGDKCLFPGNLLPSASELRNHADCILSPNGNIDLGSVREVPPRKMQILFPDAGEWEWKQSWKAKHIHYNSPSFSLRKGQRLIDLVIYLPTYLTV